MVYAMKQSGSSIEPILHTYIYYNCADKKYWIMSESHVLGIYDTEEKAQAVFNDLVFFIDERGKGIYYMPSNEELNG